MKLIHRITIYYLLITLVIFFSAGYVFYVTFKDELYEEIDEQLRDEKRYVERFFEQNGRPPEDQNGINLSVQISAVPEALRKGVERKDTTIMHPQEGELIFRQWRFYVSDDKSTYECVIRNSLLDMDDLGEEIGTALAAGFGLLLLSALILNFFLIRYSFRPFYHTLHELRRYSPGNTGPLSLPRSGTSEFNELNKALESMSGRIQDDYNNIREYTQNASHEIQTPLAIIINKLELLMQDENIGEHQAELLQGAYQAANRLSRMNVSLIQLTRITNREYHESSEIDLALLCSRLSDQLKEQFTMKSLQVDVRAETKFFVNINSALAEVMLMNLLVNAIRYTDEHGRIIIESTSSSLKISNEGAPLPFPKEKIFTRFGSGPTGSGSLGIGLSLVNKIAEIFSLKVNYSYDDGMHHFRISRG